MKKRILLINPPWFILQRHISTQVPMGLCYIAAVLEEQGHEVLIWNADYTDKYSYISEGSSSLKVERMADQYNEYKKNLHDTSFPIWNECYKTIGEFSPDYVGISAYTSCVISALKVAHIVKAIRPEAKVILGGPHATIYPEELIGNIDVDFVVIGEGETTARNLISADHSVQDLSSIKGLYYKDAGKIMRNPCRDSFEDVNAIQFPAKHLVKDKESMPAISFQIIYSSRGCPYNCIFCGSYRTHGKKIRYRNPASVVDEIVHTQKRFGTYNFFFCDDTFTANPGHAEAIINEILARKLNIAWSCQTRPEKLSNELAEKMKQSGCQRVSVGVETGSERIRSLIKKGNRLDDIERGFDILKRKGIDTVGFFMFGFPTETKEEIHETIAFMKKLDPVIAHCNIVTPDPGTELMAMIMEQNTLPGIPDWSNFYHQNPDMFLSKEVSLEDKQDLIKYLQKTFDHHNRKHFRKDLIRRLPFYLKLIMKEKLYRNPRYLIAQAQGLI
jgi:anaerobic magnesium-protoporphyrin IX monomethyl ester cyclase